MDAGGRQKWDTPPPPPYGEPQTYWVSFPTATGPQGCPVKGCSGRVATMTELRVNFFHRHVRDTMVILEEVNLPHPRCPRCDMMTPLKDLNIRHTTTAQCAKWSDQKQSCLTAEEMRESTARAFQACNSLIETVTSLKYLGQIMTDLYNNWLAVVGNMRKVSKRWARL